MTTWSVVKDDTREKQWRDFFPRLLPRFTLWACVALVVVSLGASVTPAQPRKPAEPPFSEQARAAALSEALRLSAAGEQLGQAVPGPASGAAQASISRTVSLLTTQARALLAPGDAPLAAASPTPSPLPPSSVSGLVDALASSGGQRLADAAKADGGMARLLAAVGTAQLLQASALAAAAGAAPPAQVPAAAEVTAPERPGACPPESAAASSSAGGQHVPSGAATLAAALARAVRTEAETVYGYQVALTRLSGEAAAAAAAQLARHEALLSGAEALSRLHCVPIPPREAGYTLESSFLASPATGLAGLEAATLPVYGDLVALSTGETRQWAVSALLGGSRRAAAWGADTGPVPGLAADPAAFPPLPAESPGPAPSPRQARAG